MTFCFSPITAIDRCRAVVDLQIAVWGRDSEVVPASVLFVSAKRGGILIGAYDCDSPARTKLLGFVWSMPGWKDRKPTQWSHMLGVLPEARRHGIGEGLKWAQRGHATAQGVELIEWTFDPLQAPNAHLNFAHLGAIAKTYLVDAYGEMTGPLHRGTATDRLIAEWWIAEPHVTRRMHRETRLDVRSVDVASAEPAIITRAEGPWVVPASVDVAIDDPRLRVPIPANFTAMQQQAPDRARAWREATRTIFTSYFARGYRAVDFRLDRDFGGGVYLLAKDE